MAPMAKRSTARRKTIFLQEEQIAPHARAFGKLFDARRIQTLFALRALAQRIDEDYNAWLAPYGLTASKLSYLATLFSADGHALPLTALSKRIRTSNANVSVMIDTLEDAGLVERRRDDVDRRYTLAVLTPKGLALIRRSFPAHLPARITFMGVKRFRYFSSSTSGRPRGR